MPADQNPQSSRRQHFHRGRRGPDRRGPDRRPPQGGQERGADHVDVDQIMRDIRAQISQRHGIELSTQQIQELAARRLEAILDPRTVKPTLLDQLRRSAGTQVEISSSDTQPAYTFEGHTLYESHNGLLRFIRRLLNPILRLFFNPNPIVLALNAQARMNTEAARREAERDRRQTEWNALHYTILQRLVTEVSRGSIESQSLSMRVESLAAKVDFNERRVRGLEQTAHQTTSSARVFDEAAVAAPSTSPKTTSESIAAEGQSEGSRRRRRRRRGRRGGAVGPGPIEAPGMSAAAVTALPVEGPGPELEDEEPEDLISSSAEVQDEPNRESGNLPVDTPSGPVSTEGVSTDGVPVEGVSIEEIAIEEVSIEEVSIEAISAEPVFEEPRPREETPEATPSLAEPAGRAEAEPSQAPDEPLPTAPPVPPDPGPPDR